MLRPLPPPVTTPPGRRVTVVAPGGGAARQGYFPLISGLASRHGVHLACGPSSTLHRIAVALVRRRVPGARSLPPTSAFAIAVHRRCSLRPSRHLLHFPWAESAAPFLAGGAPSIATVHQPVASWPAHFAGSLGRLAGVITVADPEAVALRALFPGLPVACLPMGVDLDFWSPGSDQPSAPRRHLVLGAGRHLRNLPMFARVCRRLADARPDVDCRLLLNPDFPTPPDIAPHFDGSRLAVLRGLSDVELRDLHRQATVVFMPYHDVTASNAIVEALATATPIVTTRVPGMETYGGDTTMVRVEDDDDEAALAALHRLLDSPADRAALGRHGREFAARELPWNRIIDAHIAFYSAVEARLASV